MLNKPNFIKYLAAVSAVTLTALIWNLDAQPSAQGADGSGVRLMPISELREGMKGKALTVFHGNVPEEFGVEILGVLPGAIGPKQDLIIGRLSGGPAERTAVFAGMSGSPVYIDGRLIGAISYSFPFSKEAICGITPIEQMIAIFEKKQPAATAREPRAFSFAELASSIWSPEFPGGVSAKPASSNVADSRIAAVGGQSFQPIATPLTFSGFSQASLDLFGPQLMQAGLLPVSSAGGAAAITPMKKAEANTLVGGTSVSMELARGDYSLAASGTVTLRDNGKVYAFGHPFLGLGSSDLPMSESHVITVIPNLSNSFKLAVPDAMVGSMTQDRATGVFGALGQAPKMIPVHINLQTSRGETRSLNIEIINDDFLTPLLLNISLYNALTSTERTLGDSTIEMTGEIDVKGNEPIKLDRRLTGGQSAQLAAGSVAVPVNALLRSQFDDVAISGININLRAVDGSRMATLESLSVDRNQVKPGETVEVQAFARASSGRLFVERIPIMIPPDAPVGPVSIVVGDGGVIQQNSALQQFVPKSAAELISTINRLKLPDRLYVQAVRTTAGAVIGVNEMPNLPPSMLATLNNDRTAGGYKPYLQTVIADRELPPAEFVISGQQKLEIQIVK
jgi:hypothetical protein